MKGRAAKKSGTIAAVVPIDVPTMKRVKGMIATIRMIKGVERAAFTITPKIRLTNKFYFRPPRAVTVRTIPRGTPNKTARKAAVPIM
jgi:hypothetical protein